VTVKAKLRVNQKPVEMNRFVADLLGRVCVAMVSALKGTENMREIDIQLEKEEVIATVNGQSIPLNAFTSEVIANTVRGLVSSLKGVGDTSRVSIGVEIE
jgi:hypothetical protein